MTDITILMPCLDEEKTIVFCIDQAKAYCVSRELSYEILVVDRNSADRSVEIAAAHGARVITEHRPGYGRALRTGLAAAKGNTIIYGDCDSTYDFSDLDAFYWPLAVGRYEFITGNRFAGQMEPGAMILSHKLGVPFLSWCGRMKFGIQIHDWHCGLRGIRQDSLKKLRFKTTGMEFAIEMLAEVSRKGLDFDEVSVSLKKAKFQRKEKLRTIRDGFRHLCYIIKA